MWGFFLCEAIISQFPCAPNDPFLWILWFLPTKTNCLWCGFVVWSGGGERELLCSTVPIWSLQRLGGSIVKVHTSQHSFHVSLGRLNGAQVPPFPCQNHSPNLTGCRIMRAAFSIMGFFVCSCWHSLPSCFSQVTFNCSINLSLSVLCGLSHVLCYLFN